MAVLSRAVLCRLVMTALAMPRKVSSLDVAPQCHKLDMNDASPASVIASLNPRANNLASSTHASSWHVVREPHDAAPQDMPTGAESPALATSSAEPPAARPPPPAAACHLHTSPNPRDS